MTDFESPRAKNERLRRRRVELFNMMADLATSGAITLDEAIRRYKLLVRNTERPIEDFMPKKSQVPPSEGGDA